MSHKIVASPNFKRKAKPLLKKHVSLKAKLAILGKQIAENPTQGNSLGQSCYESDLPLKVKVPERAEERISLPTW